jgi:hypothetical protein
MKLTRAEGKEREFHYCCALATPGLSVLLEAVGNSTRCGFITDTSLITAPSWSLLIPKQSLLGKKTPIDPTSTRTSISKRGILGY